MESKDIKKKVNCCITGRTLRTSNEIVMVPLPYKATWDFPIHGKILTETTGLAVAFIHEDCVKSNGELTDTIKYAVEFAKGDVVIYHDVTTLEKIL
jgi:hypothetical protein